MKIPKVCTLTPVLIPILDTAIYKGGIKCHVDPHGTVMVVQVVQDVRCYLSL